jgi:hypothetical protein
MKDQKTIDRITAAAETLGYDVAWRDSGSTSSSYLNCDQWIESADEDFNLHLRLNIRVSDHQDCYDTTDLSVSPLEATAKDAANFLKQKIIDVKFFMYFCKISGIKWDII